MIVVYHNIGLGLLAVLLLLFQGYWLLAEIHGAGEIHVMVERREILAPSEGEFCHQNEYFLQRNDHQSHQEYPISCFGAE